jgi:hypothetical protein
MNLRETFGRRYRIEYDPAHKRGDDPLLQQIPCKHGHVYIHSAELLAVATNGRKVGLRVAKLAGTVVLQEGSDGFNIAFPATMFAKVAAIVRPRRKRKTTAKELSRLAGMRNKAALKATSGAPAASGAA